MTLARPNLLWLALVAAPLVLLFLVRRRRLEQPTAYDFLWREALAGRALARRRWDGLRLLWQLAIMACWILAASGPHEPGREGAHRQLLIIDNSASMGVTVDGRTRLARAVAAAKGWLRPDTRTRLARLAPRPSVLGRDLGPGEAARLLDGIEVAPAAADGEQLAGLVAGQARDGFDRVVLFSDGCGPRMERASRGVSWATWEAGADWPANCALAEVAVDTERRDRRWRISTMVVNHGAAPVDVVVSLSGSGGVPGPLAERSVRLAAGGRSLVELEVGGDVSGRVVLRLRSPADALAVDDVARLALPRLPRAAITLVAPRDARRKFWTSILVALGDWIDRDTSRMITASEPSAEALAAPDGRFRITILDGVRLREPLPPGNYMLLGVQARQPVQAGPPAANQAVMRMRRGHPLLRHVELAELLVTRARPLVLPRTATVLAECARGALIAADREGQRAWVAFAFRVGRPDSNLPALIAFPLLLKNALLWFAGERTPVPPVLPVGRAVVLPAGARAVHGPGGEQAVTGPLRPTQPGWYRILDADGGELGEIGAHLESPAESQLRLRRPEVLVGPEALGPRRRDYTRELALVGLGLLFVGLLLPPLWAGGR